MRDELDEKIYYAKSICIQSFSSLYFPAFVLNTEIYRVNFRIKSNCGKIRTRKTWNTDNFWVVAMTEFAALRPKMVNY